MTRREKLISLRDTFDDAIASKIDIHDWTAQALALIPDLSSKVDIQISSQGIAAEGATCPLHSSRVARIRAALARAIHETEPTTAVQRTDASVPLSIAAVPQMPITSPPMSTKRRPKIAGTESGLIWIWFHSDASTLIKLATIIIGALGIGFAAGKADFLVGLWNLIRTTFIE